jgi:hypothetical protein
MPLCVSCVPNEHKTCSDVISLHDAAKNAKCSTAFTDLEDTIDGAIQNVQKFEWIPVMKTVQCVILS